MRDQFSLPITITENDIDQLDHVNNISYLRWVQEVAIAHWELLAPKHIQEKYFWVIVRHEIDYLSSAHLHSKLKSVTWVGDHSGAKSERFVNIVDENDKIIAKVKTTWCLMDMATHRPKRIEEDITSIFMK